jgi:hypothetical protein
MFPCCQLTYLKYINKDNTIDFSVIEEYLEGEGLLNVKELNVKSLGEDFLCKCACHKKGLSVIH